MALQSLKNDGDLQSLVRKWFSNSEFDMTDQVSIG